MIWDSRAFGSRFYRIVWHIVNFGLKYFLGRQITGWEHVPPQGGCIIASNHIALVDPPFLGTAAPREVIFVAKQELFRFFLIRWLITSLNAMPLRRQGGDAAAIRQILKKLAQGWAVLMFPEGTRSRTENFLPAKSGVGLIARRSLAPLVPAYIEGTNRKLSDLLKGRYKLLARFGPPITAAEMEKYPDSKEGHQQISQLVMDRITRLKENK